MSYIRSNFTVPEIPFSLDTDKVRTLTVEEFDKLTLSDQIHIYNEYPAEYLRLTGRSTRESSSHAEGEQSDAKRFADEFERRVDEALQRNFHPHGV